MKLRRVLAGILTGAMMITGIPTLGLEMAAAVPVYADQNGVDNTGAENYPNVALQKSVKTSSTDTAETAGEKAVDDKTDTAWTSKNLRQVSPQWLQIDLGEKRTAVDKIEIVYGDQVWPYNYEIQTYDSEKNEHRNVVKSVTAQGPSAVVGDEAEGRDETTKTDTIRRNDKKEKIILRRYVNISFSLPTPAPGGTDEKKVSVAEVRIFGKEAGKIYGPIVEMTAPVTGQYPEIADVKASEEGSAVYHEDLADRTTPAATLIKRGSNNPEWGEYVVNEEGHSGVQKGAKVKVPVGTTAGEPAEFTVDPINDDGVFGFTTDAQTPGVENKFNVYGDDVKIISFQLYLVKDKLPQSSSGKDAGQHINIFGKGDKLAMQVNNKRIYTYMFNKNGQWGAEESFWFDQYDGGIDRYTNRWIDVLVVVDGLGKQRLYIDKLPAKSGNVNISAIPHVAPTEKGMQPFTFGSNLADFSKLNTTQYQDIPLNSDAREHGVTNNQNIKYGIQETMMKDAAYIARFKFYSNKNYNEIENGAGTDLSDSKTLSSAFDNKKATDPFSIEALERKVGADSTINDGSNQGNAEATKKRAEVYYIITNMLQKEQPTARVSLCPYSRSTVWEKKGSAADAQWEEMAADEKFGEGAALGYGKYRAITTLIADDGFVFTSETRKNVLKSLKAGDENANSTVKISNKEREMTIITYYGCTDADVDDTCHIDEILFEHDPIHMTVGDENVAIGAEASGIGTCANHDGALAELTYELNGGDGCVELDKAKGTLKALQPTKGVIGYDPVTVTVTATLKKDGETVKNGTGANAQEVKLTRTVHVQVDPAAQQNQMIDKAPVITAQSPIKDKYPEIVKIAMPKNSAHFTDVADRMSPNATLEPMTEDYIKNSPYVKEGTQSSGNKRPANPTADWINEWKSKTVANADGTPGQYQPVIENVDGVWAFNAQGQTPGDTNKFDVFGDDIKLVSFKLYLKQWPENPYKNNAGYTEQEHGNDYDNDGVTLDIYGKGNQYAFQVGSSKKLIMYLQAGPKRGNKTEWPQQTFQPEDPGVYSSSNPDGFLQRWHDIFMVIDGKGWMRLYVDGKRSRSRGALTQASNYTELDEQEDKKRQGGAYPADPTGSARKPFTLGYNTKANHPSWYDGIFDNRYGYIADFEFYSNKNYDNVINGSGDDISEASVLPKEFADKINLAKLESDYAANLDDIGTILTNMLQESNATAMITTSPYVAKTNWYQKTSEDGEFEMLDKVDPQKFAVAGQYKSVTTLTAHDGFEFDSRKTFTDAVEANFHTEGGAGHQSVKATVDTDSMGRSRLTIEAVYREVEELCTCGIKNVAAPTSIDIQIPENSDTQIQSVTPMAPADVELEECAKEGHPVTSNMRIKCTYEDPTGADAQIIELVKDQDGNLTGIKAKQSGTVTITGKAEYQLPTGENGAYVTVQNENKEPAEKTFTITVKVTKAGEADPDDRADLGTAAQTAKDDYPISVKDDYKKEAWDRLQDAIGEAERLSADPHAKAADVSEAADELRNAVAAMENAKSEKGIAKDELKAELEKVKALYEADNADKKYTDVSWAAFKKAYEEAQTKLATAGAEDLASLKAALIQASTTGLKLAGGGQTPEETIKEGTILPGPDGTQYQLTSWKDKTVIITKGVDAQNIKVGPTVAIKNVTYRVVGIGNQAFKGMKNAKKAVIDANVTSIGDQAFANCKKLKNVTIGKDVNKIGKKAFFKCPKLNKVTLKGKALTDKGVGSKAFAKTAKKASVKWGPVKGKARTKLKKKLKKAGLKVK